MAADVIGIISGVMGIWTFVGDILAPGAADESIYRIHVGVDGSTNPDTPGEGPELNAAPGVIDAVKVYNTNHDLMGTGPGGMIGFNGHGFGDVGASQLGSQQSIFTEFFAGDDAICMAAIAATMPEGSQWGWVGDWGKLCNLDWFYSGYLIEDGKATLCTWIDKDHTNDIKAGVLGIKWPAFKGTKDSVPTEQEARAECGKGLTAWRNEGEQQMLPLADAKFLAAASSGPRPSRRFDDSLVVSRHRGQNATELCASDTALGPDFVSEDEGVYCNMETHETAPLCSKDPHAPECFDWAHPEGPAMIRRKGKRSLRKPSKVVHWG
ncbi:hypothetical protein PG985_006368 [Apiospora marii]|uniref:uncharacterized protein n=1 Tax=Apiospora marii TaxID=335849 RepID=UPI00312F507D